MVPRLSACLWGLALVAVVAVGCSDDDNGDGDAADLGPAHDVADTTDTTPSDGDTAGADGDTTATDGDVADTRSDADIGDGGDDTSGDVILLDADSSSDDADAGPMCESDGQCPGNAVCEDGDCRFYRFVQIKDVTRDRSSSADGACAEDSAGADLFQLELQGPFGRVLGYAQATAGELKATTNTDAGDVFDGVGNSLKDNDGALCPSGGFGPGSVVSLGCGGSLVVGFTDGAGDVLNLATGQRLIVSEYGDQCCSDGCPEEFWEIRVCNAQGPQQFQAGEVDDRGNHPSCDTAIVEVGSARGEVTLQMPRP